jgi:hypothetical protein
VIEEGIARLGTVLCREVKAGSRWSAEEEEAGCLGPA